MTSETLLQFRDATVGYGRRVVLQGINFSLSRGIFAGLLGANGSGKSTLLKTLLGILPPLAGRVDYGTGQPPAFGYVPQRDSLDPVYLFTSQEMVLMASCQRLGPGRRVDSAERAWAESCLAQAGAAGLSQHRFSLLSAGQKQRVLIARALATRPNFMVLDEPTAGIDAAASQSLMELLTRLHREQELTILMVNHDLPLVRRHVQHVFWLHEGRLLEGTPDTMLSHERLEEMLSWRLR